MNRFMLLLVAASLALPAQADVAEAITAAMQDSGRSDAERARDANRKPLETLQFFGLKEVPRSLS